MTTPYQALRDKRSGESLPFEDLATRLEAYAAAHTESAGVLEDLAGYLSFAESQEQSRLDEAIEESFPASDPPSI